MAFIKALDLLNREMRSVLHWRTAMTIEMASKGGGMLHIFVLIVFLAAAGAIRSE